MDVNEIKSTLEGLEKNLTAKSKEIVGAELKGLSERIEKMEGASEKALEVLKNEITQDLDGLKTVIGKLDGKLSEKAANEKAGGDQILKAITANAEKIFEAKSGRRVFLEKVVGDMTLGNNLTGDQPRDYDNVVKVIPGQAVNVADLVQSITIAGGTYTFPREGAGEGGFGTQVEGSAKSQRDYDFTMVDVNTDFIAGFAVYSKKMANNLPYLESFLPGALRRDYWIEENDTFEALMAAGVTASTELAASHATKMEQLIAEIATLEGANETPNAIVVTPADYWDMIVSEKSTGAGYGLPGVVSLVNGNLTVNGIPVVRANWLDANKYYVGDFSVFRKVITEGLSLEFSTEDSDNFRKNNITARMEAQVGFAIHRPAAVIYGDFTAV